MTGTIEQVLSDIGVVLPEPTQAIANYVPYILDGGHLYISGQLPMEAGNLAFEGKLGAEVSVEQGARAARLCAINVLAQARGALSDLDQIEQVVKLTGFVNCTPDFTNQPGVVNGASDFMVQVFGDRGRHARSAVGCSSLPLGASVEVEAILRVAVR